MCIRDSGHCKLLDFGTMAEFGVTGDVAGTPPMVAPETLRGMPLDHRADLFSLGALAYWIALIICLVMVLGIWDIDIGLSNTLVPFLPKVFAALVILILGLFIASIVEDLVRAGAAHSGVKYAYYVGKVVKWVLVVFIVLTAVQQLEIQTEFITWGFLIILGSVCLAMSLANGLGSREVVASKLRGWVEKMDVEAQEAAEKVAEEEE